MPFDNPRIDPIIERLRFGWQRLQRGWCKGTAYKAPLGRWPARFCAMGSVTLNDQGNHMDPGNIATDVGTRAGDKLMEAAMLLTRADYMNVPTYNDFSSRTLGDMGDLFAVAEELVLRM